MKFLKKIEDSMVLEANLLYKKNRPANNKKLKEILLKEQFNFCAYTEKYIEPLDSSEVDHFNSSIKYNDDYYNYYTVLRFANLRKKDEKYKGASFFNNRFYQDKVGLQARVIYLKTGVFEELDEGDEEAKGFVDFLQLNNYSLVRQRRSHINRLINIFENANYSKNDRLNHFREVKEDLSFITALEVEFELDLSEFYS